MSVCINKQIKIFVYWYDSSWWDKGAVLARIKRLEWALPWGLSSE